MKIYVASLCGEDGVMFQGIGKTQSAAIANMNLQILDGIGDRENVEPADYCVDERSEAGNLFDVLGLTLVLSIDDHEGL